MINTSPFDEPNHPTALHVVQSYRPVLRRIVEALRKGTSHARWYFDHMDENIDNGLAPALVRKGAKRELQATNIDVANEEDATQPEHPTAAMPQPTPPNGKAEFLSNLGLAVSAEGIRFRVLRSDDGVVPVPGPSKARQAFYSQQAYLPGVAWLPEVNMPVIPSDVTNCVLHWDTDEEYNLRRVYLALPLAGKETRDSVDLLWNEIVWRKHAPEVDGTQAEAEIIDQDIYISGEGTGTGG